MVTLSFLSSLFADWEVLFLFAIGYSFLFIVVRELSANIYSEEFTGTDKFFLAFIIGLFYVISLKIASSTTGFWITEVFRMTFYWENIEYLSLAIVFVASWLLFVGERIDEELERRETTYMVVYLFPFLSLGSYMLAILLNAPFLLTGRHLELIDIPTTDLLLTIITISIFISAISLFKKYNKKVNSPIHQTYTDVLAWTRKNKLKIATVAGIITIGYFLWIGLNLPDIDRNVEKGRIITEEISYSSNDLDSYGTEQDITFVYDVKRLSPLGWFTLTYENLDNGLEDDELQEVNNTHYEDKSLYLIEYSDLNISSEEDFYINGDRGIELNKTKLEINDFSFNKDGSECAIRFTLREKIEKEYIIEDLVIDLEDRADITDVRSLTVTDQIRENTLNVGNVSKSEEAGLAAYRDNYLQFMEIANTDGELIDAYTPSNNELRFVNLIFYADDQINETRARFKIRAQCR